MRYLETDLLDYACEVAFDMLESMIAAICPPVPVMGDYVVDDGCRCEEYKGDCADCPYSGLRC